MLYDEEDGDDLKKGNKESHLDEDKDKDYFELDEEEDEEEDDVEEEVGF